jgi:ankyrin repeat protein
VATAQGRLEAARLLLDAGADPSRAGGDGVTPLMYAAATGQLEVLQLLLERGAAVDTVVPGNLQFLKIPPWSPAGDGTSAFHSACWNNHPDCAEELARAGCDVGLKANGVTGRELAEQRGHTVVLERLRLLAAAQLRAAQAAGPEPEAAPPSGEALGRQLWDAAQTGDGPAVARLLAAGADPKFQAFEAGCDGPILVCAAKCYLVTFLNRKIGPPR